MIHISSNYSWSSAFYFCPQHFRFYPSRCGFCLSSVIGLLFNQSSSGSERRWLSCLAVIFMCFGEDTCTTLTYSTPLMESLLVLFILTLWFITVAEGFIFKVIFPKFQNLKLISIILYLLCCFKYFLLIITRFYLIWEYFVILFQALFCLFPLLFYSKYITLGFFLRTASDGPRFFCCVVLLLSCGMYF